MTVGFELTPDLVRFRVRGSSALIGSLIELSLAEGAAERPWFGGSLVRVGHSDTSEVEFFCSKASAPRVLDLLETYGAERVQSLE